VQSVLFKELQAIAIGLASAEDLRLQKVKIGSDSLRAVKAINKLEEPPWYCRDLVAEIQWRVHKFTSVEFNHVFRESNRATDYLAGKLGVVNQCNVFMGPPDEIRSVILSEDREDKTFRTL
ncbi:hypothetical protein FRX31_030076, partial [Thalictrum thalictroides]